MNNTKIDRENLMRNGNVKTTILKMSVPTIAGMLIMAVYNLVDAFFIGKLQDTAASASITVAFPLVMITSAIGLMVGVGGGSFVARELGAENKPLAGKVAATSLSIAGILALIFTIAMYVCIKPVLFFMGATPEIYNVCKVYSSWMIISSFAVVLNQTLNNLIRAEGRTDYSMRGLFIGAIVNIILDPILIFGFDKGLAGAAVATVIGQLCSLAYLSAFYLRKKSVIDFSLKNATYNKDILLQIFGIGVPVFLTQSLLSISYALLNSRAGTFGDEYVAAVGLANRIFMLSHYFLAGFNQAFQPFTAFNYGAKNYQRVLDAVKFAGTFSITTCSIIAVIFYSFPEFFVSTISPNLETTEIAANCLRAMSTTLPLVAVIYLATQLFQGTNKPKQALILSVTRQGILFIPLVLILPNVFSDGLGRFEFIKKFFDYDMASGMYGLILAQPIADLITAVISVILIIPVLKNIKKLDKDTVVE